MGTAKARLQSQPADLKGVVCRYAGVPPGSHAVAVVHDLNANDRADTNFLGMPTEQWGVSNNVRPTLRAPPCAPHLARPILRAPRFEEAAFKVIAGTEQLIIDIKVAK